MKRISASGHGRTVGGGGDVKRRVRPLPWAREADQEPIAASWAAAELANWRIPHSLYLHSQKLLAESRRQCQPA